MKVISVILGLLFGLQLKAQTLIVSDIDDTLKISHVVNFQDALDNAYRLDNLFLGMNDLYQFIANEILKKEGGAFVYLSNAPVDVMEMSHTQFLAKHKFPKGKIWLSDSYLAEDHKVNALRQLLSSRKFNRIIFLGDNGEQDSVIYDQIQKEFPEYQYETYIHLAYTSLGDGTLLRGKQVGYATPIEVVQDLTQKGRIDQQAQKRFNDLLIPQILKSSLDKEWGKLAFPAWMDCRDIKFSKNLPQDYLKFVDKRCHRE